MDIGFPGLYGKTTPLWKLRLVLCRRTAGCTRSWIRHLMGRPNKLPFRLGPVRLLHDRILLLRSTRREDGNVPAEDLRYISAT